MGTGGSFPRGKAANAWICASVPQCVFMMWCLVKHSDNFTFYLYSQVKGGIQIYFMSDLLKELTVILSIIW